MGRGGVGHFPKEPAVGQDAAAQTAAPLQPGFGSGADGLIHPVAWPTLLRAEQSNPLQQKLSTHLRVVGRTNAREMAATLGLTTAAAAQKLARLCAAGLCRVEDRSRPACYRLRTEYTSN